MIGERVRDKIAASKRKGLWVGGAIPLGYRCADKKLVVVPEEAETVRSLFSRYLLLGSMPALIEDLDEHDLLKDIAVVVWGEFGRTPRINRNGGRDHWPKVASALLAGGGMRCGQVLGSTTRWGEEPRSQPVHFRDVFATLYERLGIDVATTQFTDLTGRPQYLVGNHRPLAELIG